MNELLERELNGELTASESLELNRCRDDEVLRRRRGWRSVAATIAEDPPLRPATSARIARGVHQRMGVRDAIAAPGPVRLLPWAALAVGALTLALIGTWTEPMPEEQKKETSVANEVAIGPRGGPVEIGVIDAPVDESEELIEVVF